MMALTRLNSSHSSPHPVSDVSFDNKYTRFTWRAVCRSLHHNSRWNYEREPRSRCQPVRWRVFEPLSVPRPTRLPPSLPTSHNSISNTPASSSAFVGFNAWDLPLLTDIQLGRLSVPRYLCAGDKFSNYGQRISLQGHRRHKLLRFGTPHLTLHYSPIQLTL
jgi:hypothetical protein